MAALVLSSAAHAAIAFMASDTAPLSANPAARQAGSSRGQTLHVALSLQPSPKVKPVSSPANEADPLGKPAASAPAPGGQTPAGRRLASLSEGAKPDPAAGAQEESRLSMRPTPLTYPILALSPADDPHIVGLVRLLLVVSSEGRVVKTIVTASTLSQDYIDRVVNSFEEMRFKPGRLHGLPHTDWYEVVVNFEFDPQAATSSL